MEIAIAIVLFVAVVVLLNYGEKYAMKDNIEKIIKTHKKALYVKWLQKVRKDDYGNVDDRAWLKEKAYFHDKTIVSKLIEIYGDEKLISVDLDDTQIQGRFHEHTFSVDELIEREVFEYSRNHPAEMLNVDLDLLTPLAFEAYCAQILNENGWSANVTRGSGDQGIDIIGEKDGYKVVFQVKKYSSPVGNKAVQEAIAGKAFAAADLAYVVSNASFTPSAIALANTSEVGLLHYSELANLSPKRSETA